MLNGTGIPSCPSRGPGSWVLLGAGEAGGEDTVITGGTLVGGDTGKVCFKSMWLDICFRSLKLIEQLVQGNLLTSFGGLVGTKVPMGCF